MSEQGCLIDQGMCFGSKSKSTKLWFTDSIPISLGGIISSIVSWVTAITTAEHPWRKFALANIPKSHVLLPEQQWWRRKKFKTVKSRVQQAWQAGKEWRGGGVVRAGCFLADQTIFLMLGLLKLPALRCFWTWLAEPWRVRPPLDRAELGDSWTFSLSTPGGPPGAQTTHCFRVVCTLWYCCMCRISSIIHSRLKSLTQIFPQTFL